MKTTALTVCVLVLSFIGIADAWYLAQSAYTGAPLLCNIGAELDGCNIVAQSAYSKLFGLPLALYGVFFYAFLFVLSALALARPRRAAFFSLYWLGIIGLVASFVFVGIQLSLIKAICVYCFGSALISFVIFACTFTLWKRMSRGREPVVMPWERASADVPPANVVP
jgi:uncharacterized membrane protein